MLSVGSASRSSIHVNKIGWHKKKENGARERMCKAHLSSISGLLMNPAIMYHSHTDRVKLNLWLQCLNSNDVKLLISAFVNKVYIMFDRAVSQGRGRPTRRGKNREKEGKVIKRLQFQRACLSSHFSFYAAMPFWLSGKAESVQQDYGQQLMSYLVLAMLPGEMMVLLAAQFVHSCTHKYMHSGGTHIHAI